jgi:hypothetical protein
MLPIDKLRVRGMVAALLSVVTMTFYETEVDEVIREAERVAFERGWHPPLARRSAGGP